MSSLLKEPKKDKSRFHDFGYTIAGILLSAAWYGYIGMMSYYQWDFREWTWASQLACVLLWYAIGQNVNKNLSNG